MFLSLICCYVYQHWHTPQSETMPFMPQHRNERVVPQPTCVKHEPPDSDSSDIRVPPELQQLQHLDSQSMSLIADAEYLRELLRLIPVRSCIPVN